LNFYEELKRRNLFRVGIAYLIRGWPAIETDCESLFRQVFNPGGRAVMEHRRMHEVAEKLLLIPVWESKGYPFGCERVQDASGDHMSCPDWPQ
jgi:hypothetical protein